MFTNDLELAKKLQQEEFAAAQRTVKKTPTKKLNQDESRPSSLIDPSWELIDPTPNIHSLFQAFDKKFFWSKLGAVEVKWSPRMYSCAGICTYKGKRGGCVVSLSLPLLKLRPRKDLIETLLHEMIHAYLFLTNNDRDRDGHGPNFHLHMNRINALAGTKISVYHSFHDEVRHYRTHWWRCDGPCRFQKPFFGMVKRAMNRAPGPSDFWFPQHKMTCGGTFVKIQEPEGFKSKKKKIDNKFDDGVKKYFKVTGGSKNGQKDSLTKPNCTPALPNLQPTNRIAGFKNVNANVKVDKIPGSTNVNGFGSTVPRGSLGGGLKTNKGGTLVVQPKPQVQPVASTSGRVDPVNGEAKPFPGSGYVLGSANGVVDRTKSKLLLLYPPRPKTSGQSDSTKVDKKEASGNTVESRVPCPVCGTVVSEDKVNEHLDACVQIDFAGDSMRVDNLPPSPSKELFANCPICGKKVYKVKMNEHVDECIQQDSPSFVEPEDAPSTSSGFNPNPPSPQKGLFTACPVCDKKVFKNKLNEHLESCLSLDSIMENSSQEIVDSTDDDADLHVVESDSQEAHCPCCDKVLSVASINAHLDQCLQLAQFDS